MLLDPSKSIAEIIGQSYDKAFEYRLVADRNKDGQQREGWSATSQKIGSLTVYRRSLPKAVEEAKAAPAPPVPPTAQLKPEPKIQIPTPPAPTQKPPPPPLPPVFAKKRTTHK